MSKIQNCSCSHVVKVRLGVSAFPYQVQLSNEAKNILITKLLFDDMQLYLYRYISVSVQSTAVCVNVQIEISKVFYEKLVVKITFVPKICSNLPTGSPQDMFNLIYLFSSIKGFTSTLFSKFNWSQASLATMSA